MADHDTNPTPGSATRPARRRRRLPLVLLVTIAVIVLTGAIGAVVVYDRATAIDRSTPAAVADQLLQAAVIHQDPEETSLFVCRDWPATVAVRELTPQVAEGVHISWAPVATAHHADGSATVTIRLRYAASSAGATAEQMSTLRLAVVQEDGWRACGVKPG